MQNPQNQQPTKLTISLPKYNNGMNKNRNSPVTSENGVNPSNGSSNETDILFSSFKQGQSSISFDSSSDKVSSDSSTSPVEGSSDLSSSSNKGGGGSTIPDSPSDDIPQIDRSVIELSRNIANNDLRRSVRMKIPNVTLKDFDCSYQAF